MRIIAFDDNSAALKNLISVLYEASPRSETVFFHDSAAALEYMKDTHCDAAFVKAELRQGSGIDLALKMKRLNPSLNIIFISSNPQLAKRAFDIHASGFLTDPVYAPQIRQELLNLRYPVNANAGCPVRLKTFGNFEAYFENKPIRLGKKAKELLAYLTDRSGAMVSNEEIYGILFEDDPGHEENLKKVKKSLTDAFQKIGCENVLLHQRGSMGIDTQTVDCDLYQWRNGDLRAVNAFGGEYMSQYSWAEYSMQEFEKQ